MTITVLTNLALIIQGKAAVARHDLRGKPDDVRKPIGIVQQDLIVDDKLTGIENLMFAAILYHVQTLHG